MTGVTQRLPRDPHRLVVHDPELQPEHLRVDRDRVLRDLDTRFRLAEDINDVHRPRNVGQGGIDRPAENRAAGELRVDADHVVAVRDHVDRGEVARPHRIVG